MITEELNKHYDLKNIAKMIEQWSCLKSCIVFILSFFVIIIEKQIRYFLYFCNFSFFIFSRITSGRFFSLKRTIDELPFVRRTNGNPIKIICTTFGWSVSGGIMFYSPTSERWLVSVDGRICLFSVIMCNLSVCLYVCPCLSACLPTCLSFCLSICLPACLLVCLFVCLLVCLPAWCTFLHACVSANLPALPECLYKGAKREIFDGRFFTSIVPN